MRKHWLISAVILSVLGTPALSASTPKAQVAATKPMSLLLMRAGNQYLAAGKAKDAIDQFETALAVDPANVEAYLGLAHANEKLGLSGKAIRFYRGALAVDPNNLAALEAQGTALVARGAMARAQINLARIKDICQTHCAAATRLAAVIQKGPPAELAAATATPAAATPAVTPAPANAPTVVPTPKPETPKP